MKLELQDLKNAGLSGVAQAVYSNSDFEIFTKTEIKVFSNKDLMATFETIGELNDYLLEFADDNEDY